jgi:uncharacterized protein (TIGR02246 family)
MRLSVYCLFVLTAANALAEGGTPKTTLEAWALAMPKGDVDAMTAFYEDSEHVVAYESRGTLRKGAKQIREMYAEAYKEVAILKATVSDLKVRTNGDTAWATARVRVDTQSNEDKTLYVLEIRGSFVLVRKDGKWLIALEHFSPIQGIPRVRKADVEEPQSRSPLPSGEGR